MSPGVLNGEATVGADVPRQKSKATPDTLRVGCIAMVEKEGQARRAEGAGAVRLNLEQLERYLAIGEPYLKSGRAAPPQTLRSSGRRST